MARTGLLRICLATLLALGISGSLEVRGAAPANEPPDFELWVADQADGPGGSGTLHIYPGGRLFRDPPREAHEIIDLSEKFAPEDCQGSQPKRPHMLMANGHHAATHVIIANFASGHVTFMRVRDRSGVGCVRTVGGFQGAGGSTAVHAAMPSPIESMVIAADVGPTVDGVPRSGFLHKIETDYETETFALVETLPLEPFAEELGTPAARPICHEFTRDGRFIYITMAQGGLLVVDTGNADGTTPMEVAKVYSKDVVPSIGCGTRRIRGQRMLVTTEKLSEDPASTTSGSDFLFVFDTSGAELGDFPDPARIALPGTDAHGSIICETEKGKLFAWIVMRLSDDINIVNLQTNEVIKTKSLIRPFSENPTGDIAEIVANKRVFVALRGPKPLTAITSQEDPNRTPGVAVLKVRQKPRCRDFRWPSEDYLLPITNPVTTTLSDGTEVTSADPHGLEVVNP